MNPLPRPCVYLVTDRRQIAPAARTLHDELTALEGFLDEVIAAAVDVIQVRERDVDARLLHDLVRRLLPRARSAGTRVLVNDRADVAITAGADGVHLPADGLPVARTRTLNERWTIGRSVHAGDAAADFAGADYLLFGTVFPSASKPAAWSTTGLAGLQTMTAATTTPVVAIGGLTPERAEACAAAGAAGAAGIRVFLPPPAGLGLQQAVPALRAALLAGSARA